MVRNKTQLCDILRNHENERYSVFDKCDFFVGLFCVNCVILCGRCVQGK